MPCSVRVTRPQISYKSSFISSKLANLPLSVKGALQRKPCAGLRGASLLPDFRLCDCRLVHFSIHPPHLCLPQLRPPRVTDEASDAKPSIESLTTSSQSSTRACARTPNVCSIAAHRPASISFNTTLPDHTNSALMWQYLFLPSWDPLRVGIRTVTRPSRPPNQPTENGKRPCVHICSASARAVF